MSKSNVFTLIITAIMLFSIASCSNNAPSEKNEIAIESNAAAFIETIEKHLNAVSNKDLAALKSTLSPEGKMQLILPGSEILNSVDSFMNYHQEWFQDTNWTFETKVLTTEIGDKIGIAITEIVYREPERNGEPYFNRMIVSYALEKFQGKWYVIKDHASSVEKSTDKVSQ